MSLHSSHLGRGSHRDDRRRRLLAEDHSAPGGGAAARLVAGRARARRPRKSENYGDAAFMDEQMQLSDLVSRRLWVHGLFAAAAAALIAGLFAAQLWIAKTLPALAGKLAMLDGQTTGSLVRWMSSLLLLWAGLQSLIVFNVRRHKVDDYQGHYRVWLWGAFCWFLMATDRAASLHDGFQQLMTAATGTRILGDGTIWWALPVALLLGAIGSRLMIDTRASRLMIVGLVLAAACYGAAFATIHQWIMPRGALAALLLCYALPVVGDLLIALSMGLAARHVLLDAEGLLPRKQTVVAKKSKAKTKLAIAKTDDDDAAATDSDSDDSGDEKDGWVAETNAGGPPVLRRVSPSSGEDDASDDEATDGDSAQSKLSKAERKAAKKRLIDERLKHQQKKAANW